MHAFVNTTELFYTIDRKLFPMLQDVTLLIKELKDGMDTHDVSVALPIGNDRYIGEPIIEMMEKMSKFIDDYKVIKDTWDVTSP